jgi:hypothetical protein
MGASKPKSINRKWPKICEQINQRAEAEYSQNLVTSKPKNINRK